MWTYIYLSFLKFLQPSKKGPPCGAAPWSFCHHRPCLQSSYFWSLLPKSTYAYKWPYNSSKLTPITKSHKNLLKRTHQAFRIRLEIENCFIVTQVMAALKTLHLIDLSGGEINFYQIISTSSKIVWPELFQHQNISTSP